MGCRGVIMEKELKYKWVKVDYDYKRYQYQFLYNPTNWNFTLNEEFDVVYCSKEKQKQVENGM